VRADVSVRPHCSAMLHPQTRKPAIDGRSATATQGLQVQKQQQDHAAHACELNAAGLQGVATTDRVCFAARLQFLGDGFIAVVVESASCFARGIAKFA